MPERILITGGAGFVGHHLVDHILKNTDWNIIIVDTFKFDATRRLKEINALNHPRVACLHADNPWRADFLDVTYIVDLGGKTRIADSIKDADSFVLINVNSAMKLLQHARTLPKLKKFLYFSTDEVFGPPLDQSFEWDNYNSQNPYAASKAASEELCLAWATTYGVPILITHCQNLIGERQQLEKFLPTIVHAGLKKKTVQVYVDANTGKSGRRNYLHAREAASAVMFLLEHGAFREKYNITGDNEISNFDFLLKVSDIMKRGIHYEMVKAEEVRPGFSLRYGLNGDELKRMGWKPTKSFEQNLTETVLWMMDGDNWHWVGMR